MDQSAGMLDDGAKEQGLALLCISKPCSDCKIQIIEEVGRLIFYCLHKIANHPWLSILILCRMKYWRQCCALQRMHELHLSATAFLCNVSNMQQLLHGAENLRGENILFAYCKFELTPVAFLPALC